MSRFDFAEPEIHVSDPSGSTASGYVDLGLKTKVEAGDKNLGEGTACKKSVPEEHQGV